MGERKSKEILAVFLKGGGGYEIPGESDKTYMNTLVVVVYYALFTDRGRNTLH